MTRLLKRLGKLVGFNPRHDEDAPRFLIITNTLHPYEAHNIAVLSLLPGSTYRFRYESPFFAMDRDQINGLIGKCGLLCLRDFDRATFIPLRSFRCFNVDHCGEFIFLELEFLSYVKYSAKGRVFEVSEKDSLEKQQDAVNRAQAAQTEREKYSQIIAHIVEGTGVENRPGDHLKKLIIPCEQDHLVPIQIDDRSNDSVSVSFWSRVVTLLGGISSYRKACFYLIGSIRDLSSGNKATRFQSSWRRGYKLYAGRSYALQVYQLIAGGQAPPTPGYAVKLTTLEKHMLPMRATEPVDGAYDRLEFYFSVYPQAQRRTQSVLVVECDQKLSDPQDVRAPIPIPGSLIHILVKWTKWEFFRRRVIPIPIVVAGVGFWFYAHALSTWVGHGVKDEHVQLLALFVLAVGFQNWGVFTGGFKSPAGTKA